MDYSGTRHPTSDPPQCTATMDNFYSHVISDVITKCGSHFLDESIGLEILEELKTTWTAKVEKSLKTSKENATKLNVSKLVVSEPKLCDVCTHRQEIKREHPYGIKNEQIINGHTLIDVKDIKIEPEDEWREVAYTLPLQINILADPPFAITVYVTQDQIDGNRIGALMTVELLDELMQLSIEDATDRMQTLVDEDFKYYMQLNLDPSPSMFVESNNGDSNEYIPVGNVDQHRSNPGSLNFMQFPPASIANPVFNNTRQVDGAADGISLAGRPIDSESDADDLPENDDGDDDDDDDSDDDSLAELLGEEDDSEPDPDSNDDITEEEVGETDNLILCQFTHVKRQKNHWKFRFENGIMIIDGVEFVFQRATGEGYW